MSLRCAEIVCAGCASRLVRGATRVAIGCALVATSTLPGAAPAAASSYPIVHASRTEPLDFDYRLEGTTSLVLQVFDDGEAVHVQPAPGTPPARLRPLSGELRPRGPYLIVAGLPARIALIDGADPSRRVDIVHRRRVRARCRVEQRERGARVATCREPVRLAQDREVARGRGRWRLRVPAGGHRAVRCRRAAARRGRAGRRRR